MCSLSHMWITGKCGFCAFMILFFGELSVKPLCFLIVIPNHHISEICLDLSHCVFFPVFFFFFVVYTSFGHIFSVLLAGISQKHPSALPSTQHWITEVDLGLLFCVWTSSKQRDISSVQSHLYTAHTSPTWDSDVPCL